MLTLKQLNLHTPSSSKWNGIEKYLFYFFLTFYFYWSMGSIPGSGRSPGEGNGNLFQYSCLKNPMDRGAWSAAPKGLQRDGHDWARKHKGYTTALWTACEFLHHLQTSLLKENNGDRFQLLGQGRELMMAGQRSGPQRGAGLWTVDPGVPQQCSHPDRAWEVAPRVPQSGHTAHLGSHWPSVTRAPAQVWTGPTQDSVHQKGL